MGTNISNMLSTSAGVKMAAKMAMANQAMRRFLRNESASRMPSLAKNSITIGVWNDSPKTRGSNRAKESHSLSRRSGSKPSHSLNHKRAWMAFGMTMNSHS